MSELKTLIVSVHTDKDEDDRRKDIVRQLRPGWTVLQMTSLVGKDAGPRGGGADHDVRLEVIARFDNPAPHKTV
ncbi:hypothetical protein BH23ACT11_BH23ACT11_17620 [soil metagenome]